MVLRSVERRLERLVEGTMGRLFKGGVRPLEIGHRIARTMTDTRSVGVKGQPVVANDFTVTLAPDDLARFAEIRESLVRELCDAAREHARSEGWSFMGPVKVELAADAGLRTGSFEVEARMKEADGGTGVLVLPTGEQMVLSEYLVSFGRLPECTVTFDDSNVSRRHAEIRPEGDGFVLTDLGSTNGTLVNGTRVTRHRLSDGDRITLGATEIEFRTG